MYIWFAIGSSTLGISRAHRHLRPARPLPLRRKVRPRKSRRQRTRNLRSKLRLSLRLEGPLLPLSVGESRKGQSPKCFASSYGFGCFGGQPQRLFSWWGAGTLVWILNVDISFGIIYICQYLLKYRLTCPYMWIILWVKFMRVLTRNCKETCGAYSYVVGKKQLATHKLIQNCCTCAGVWKLILYIHPECWGYLPHKTSKYRHSQRRSGQPGWTRCPSRPWPFGTLPTNHWTATVSKRFARFGFRRSCWWISSTSRARSFSLSLT